MSEKSAPNKQRIIFLDNIRTLTVIFVLVFHSGACYSSAVDFWPFHENSTSGLIDFYMLLCDTFMMSTLFFVSGYFAVPSYKKRGTKQFIKDKAKLLGIPWLIITTCVLPILDYINYSFNLDATSVKIEYGDYWLQSMKKILEFNVGFLDMSKFIIMPEQYYQRYVWYISLLLAFFIIFAIVVNCKPSLITHKSNKVSKESKVKAFSIVSIITIILFAFMKLSFYDNVLDSGWFSLGNLLEFQLGKVTIYAVYFIFGIYAYLNKWGSDRNGFGPIWIWGIINFSLFGINMFAFKVLGENIEPSLVYKLLHVVFYPLWVLSFLGLFLEFGYRYLNKDSKFTKLFSSNSYNMYLVHYVFPMTIPLIFSVFINTSINIKFLLVASLTILLSYSISEFIIKKYPRQFTVSIIGVNLFFITVSFLL